MPLNDGIREANQTFSLDRIHDGGGKMAMSEFTYVDLFAGIGGFHCAMADLGGRCVMACEIDKECKQTYSRNFKNEVC